MGDLTVMQKQEIARGAQAMGAMMGRQARKKAEKLTSPLTTLNFWGQALSVLAFVAVLILAGFMVFDASELTVNSGRAATVARETVNIRQSPTTGSTVIAQAHEGDGFTITGSRGSWTEVRLADGKGSGWISSGLVDTRTVKTMVVSYDMKGYFTAIIISLAVLFFALRMKRVGAPLTKQSGARVNPNETLLVDQK